MPRLSPVPRFVRVLALAPLVSLLAACGTSSKGTSGEETSPAAATGGDSATTASATSNTAAIDDRVSRADQNRILGDPNAKLWILVVSDFQCPFCAQWERETAPQVIKEFVDTGKARLAFLNFPLQQHRAALPAAEAAMCAGAQGKFWAMKDRIFALQSEWSVSALPVSFFETAAGELGLDIVPFKQCMADHVMREMIQGDVNRAVQAGAKSTPTFFIGNVMIAGAEKIEAFRSSVTLALQQQAK